jgi:hypothetical protein
MWLSELRVALADQVLRGANSSHSSLFGSLKNLCLTVFFIQENSVKPASSAFNGAFVQAGRDPAQLLGALEANG